MPHVSSNNRTKPYTLDDLPAMVAKYGQMRQFAKRTSTSTGGGRITRNVGSGQSGFNLVETDLTSSTPNSDEREPATSPTGNFIAFTSDGADTNGDGRIDSRSNGGFRHIWIMSSDGSNQRQVTGLSTFDAGRNQTHPTWSPEGNQLAYSDEDTDPLGDNVGGSQLWVVSTVDPNPVPSQRTFFAPGRYNVTQRAFVTSPAWAPSGQSIAFVTNYDGRNNTALPTKDIFSIAPRGLTNTLVRITGETDPSSLSTDPVGNTTDDDHPAWAVVNTDVLYFSSNRDINGKLADNVNTSINEAGGRRIWRVFADGTGLAPISDPLQRSNGRADDQDDYPTSSVQTIEKDDTTTRESVSFQTNTYLDDSDQADGARGRDLNIWTLLADSNTFDPDTQPTAALEGAGDADVVTNILSSPANFAASRLTAPQDVDRAADREPSYSRDLGDRLSIRQLVFASGRTYAPNTNSNIAPTATPVPTSTPAPANVPTATPVPTATTASTPVPNNTGGGDQFSTGGTESGATHDIWTTSTQDTTPPTLLPQSVGNLRVPVVAPQADSPFFAPRTPEAGLRPGLVPTAAEIAQIRNSATTNTNSYARRGGLRFAVVLRDTESGLLENTSTTTSNAVTVRFFNADAPTYTPIQLSQTDLYRNDENVFVDSQLEGKPLPAVINGASSFTLNSYDDGPVSNGGHEQQAGAIAGDGSFYCEGLLPTPAEGDYYIDVTARDRSGNSFTYDNIWGISTRTFKPKADGTNDLFVSDYTCGQIFPYTLTQAVGGFGEFVDFGDQRLYNMRPVESYWLSSPATTGYDAAKDGKVLDTAVDYSFQPSRVDVWRILCRGPINEDVLNAYRPTIVRQIDPNVPNPTSAPTAVPSATPTPRPGETPGPTATPTATPLPFSQLTRNVAVANHAVIWAAPYTGSVFVGPGSLIDAAAQSDLSAFMQDGGRLFVAGRDVARALSSVGTVANNNFLNNELATSYTGEVDTRSSNTITATDAKGLLYIDDFFANSGPRFDYYGGYLDLQFAFRGNPGNNNDGHYLDGAISLNNNQLFDFPTLPPNAPDVINPTSPPNTTITADYNFAGATIGQRILHTNRNNGLESRAVFFSFGFEALNRRWRNPTPSDGRAALNQRAALAEFILRYFKTTGISGRVINSSTTQPVANFLLRVVERDFTNLGRVVNTYFVRTDANGTYTLTGLPNNVYDISPYTTGNPPLTSPQGYFGGTPIRVRIVGGQPIVANQNLSVTPTLPGSVIGRAVTSNGTFSNRIDDTPLPNIPVLIRSVGTSPAFGGDGRTAVRFSRLTTTAATGDFSFSSVPALAEMEVIFNPNPEDIPSDSNITYGGPNPNYGRRVLPDAIRPLNPIIVPSGDNFYLNDVGSVTINGTTYTVTADNKSPDTAADQRVPIIVPRGPAITGVVNINGTAAAGAQVQLFVANEDGTASSTQVTGSPVQYTSGTATTTDGKFTFVDVPAKTAANGGTNYVIRATITRDNVTLVRDVPITLNQGQDQAQNVDFFLATLSGRVLQSVNGSSQPAANATVTLQYANGSVFVPTRTARTNSSGNYTLANVPVGGYTYDSTQSNPSSNRYVFKFTSSGGTATYKVVASLNALTGDSGTVNVRATDTAVTVKDIVLVNNQMVGRVNLQVDNTTATALSGATVQLLNSSGTVIATTTSGSDGSYGFTIPATGTYQVRATYKGSTTTSASFTRSPGVSTGPTVTVRLRTVKGFVYDQTSGSNVPVVGATVTLKQGSTVVATTTSGTGGAFTFAPVAPGENFTVTAVKNSLSGSSAAFTLTNSAVSAKSVTVYVKTQVVVNPNPTTFDRGRTYSVSFPYETSANALTRNIFDRSNSDAKISMTDAFNYAPTATVNGKLVRYYSVSRFNPTSLAYEPVADNGTLTRGEGYLLQVSAVPANGTKLQLQTPADDATLKGLTSTNANVEKKFYINLVWNSSLTGNSLNGRNLIGFGFNPDKYSAVAWDSTNTVTDPNKASVQINYAGKAYTIYQAVQAGLISPSLTTINPSNGQTVNATSVVAFGGYFVMARKAGVRLLFQFPQSNN